MYTRTLSSLPSPGVLSALLEDAIKIIRMDLKRQREVNAVRVMYISGLLFASDSLLCGQSEIYAHIKPN